MQIKKLVQEAFQAIKKGDNDEAVRIFEEISSLDTEDAEEIFFRGKLALELGENVFALQSFTMAVEQQPGNFDYVYSLACAYGNSGNLSAAAKYCQKATELKPDRPEPYYILGKEAETAGRFTHAAEFYEKAVQLKPSDPLPYSGLVQSLRFLVRHEEALGYAKKLLRLNECAKSHIAISRVLVELGRTEEAIIHIQKAIKMDSTLGQSYAELASIKKFKLEDVPYIKKLEKVLGQSMTPEHRSQAHFGLGKMYDDVKDWGRAFEHYKQANILMKDTSEPREYVERCKQARKIYDASFLGEFKGCGSDSEVPVFIVGMPRSGTTLIEQVIDSHPEGCGAGELLEIGGIHSSICPDNNTSKKYIRKNLDSDILSLFASSYLDKLKSVCGDAVRVVDKLPDNFTYIGLIYLLFPNARVIHVMRNPLDTCLSCYFQSLVYIPETYDLEWLGNRYRVYREAMNYWKKLLPQLRVIDVQYEDLVEDFENESRRIIDFCGLPWNDACLEYYKAPRAVITASLWQVRQPIYSSSRKRWVNYAKHLKPLADRISDYLDEEDVAELEKQGVKLNKKSGLGFLKRVFSN